MDGEQSAEQFLPLTEATFYILAGLGVPRHGYAVIQEVDRMSEGRVGLGPGTLYGALQRMIKQELIERLDSLSGEDDRRKLYRLTPLGREVVALQVARFREMVHYGEQALSESGGAERVQGDEEHL